MANSAVLVTNISVTPTNSPQAEPENSVVLVILSPVEVCQDLTTPVEREHLLSSVGRVSSQIFAAY